MAQPESFSISARRRISAHKATFMASCSLRRSATVQWPGARFAQFHEPLAGLRPEVPTWWRQGEHLSKANLMGDQIVGQQFFAGLDQGWQRHPQQRGQRAVAVER